MKAQFAVLQAGVLGNISDKEPTTLCLTLILLVLNTFLSETDHETTRLCVTWSSAASLKVRTKKKKNLVTI